MKNIKGLILAAGRGSRMGSLTDKKPKCFLKIRNLTLFQNQINNFYKNDIKNLTVVTGYLSQLFVNLEINKIENKNWKSTNMLYSLLCADNWIENCDVIVSYSDIYYEESAIRLLSSSNADIGILFDKNWYSLWKRRFDDPLDDAESFLYDTNYNLIDIGQKTKTLDRINGQYMGLLKFSNIGWDHFKNVYNSLSDIEKNNFYLTDILNKIINLKKINIKVIPYNDFWFEIDSKRDYLLFKESFNLR